MENASQNNYLGKEKLSKLLAKFAIPCILSLIISCLYNIVDQIFVGNMVGTAGNAATGIVFPITVIGWGASLSLLRDVLLIISSLIIPTKFGVTGIFRAAPVADVIAFVITLFVMLNVWKSLKTADKNSSKYMQ